MTKGIFLALGSLVVGAFHALAEPDIVTLKSGVMVFGDPETGKTYGTFWNPDTSASDYGYESFGGEPTIAWSKDRNYVAVDGGSGRNQNVYLYQVSGRTLKPIDVPALNEEQATELSAIKRIAAEGTNAVRWQSDGTLLLRYWAVERIDSDKEEQKMATVWADVEVSGTEAKIVGTSSVEPNAPSSSSATPEAPRLAQGDSGEQPPDESTPAFRFDRQNFYLRGDEGGIREYLTKGETFEHWNTLMSIRGYRGTDPRAYAFAVVKNAKESDSRAFGQVMENDEAGSYIADFLVYSEAGTKPPYAEWNLMRVEKKGRGLEVVQYAQRFYEVDDSTADEIKAARKRIVPLLAEFEDPR